MQNLIPIIAIICTIGLPIVVGWVLGLNWIKARHAERMGLINQGIIPPSESRKRSNPNKLVELRNGCVLGSLGIGVALGAFLSINLSLDSVPSMLIIGASTAFFLGIGYLTYFLVARKMDVSQVNDDID